VQVVHLSGLRFLVPWGATVHKVSIIRVTTVSCGFEPWAPVAAHKYTVSRIQHVSCEFEPRAEVVHQLWLMAGRAWVCFTKSRQASVVLDLRFLVQVLAFQTGKESIVPGIMGSMYLGCSGSVSVHIAKFQ
jgi:hypothetical protein